MRKALLIAIVILVFLALGAYFYFVDPYTSRLTQARVHDALNASSMPSELREAVYLLAPQNGGALYQNGSLTYEEYKKDGSLVLDYAKSGSTEAKIVYRPLTNIYDLVINDVVIHSGTGYKKSLDVSPLGTSVGVAVLTEGATGAMADWNVLLFNTVTGTELVREGVAGAFLGDDAFIVVRKDGMYAVFPDGGEGQVLERPFTSSRIVVSAQKSGMYFAYAEASPSSQAGILYEVIRGGSAISLVERTGFSAGFTEIAIGTDALYGLTASQDGRISLFQIPLKANQGQSVVRTYEKNLAPTKIDL